jgi:hypothetical protein
MAHLNWLVLLAGYAESRSGVGHASPHPSIRNEWYRNTVPSRARHVCEYTT